MDLLPVAMFRELYRGERDYLPSIFDAVSDSVEPDRAEIIDYMRASTRGFDVMESVPDLFAPDTFIPGAPSLHTDGDWIWRTDSLRYVINHNITLPIEFVEQVRLANYRPAPITYTPELGAAIQAWW
ncbi:hypothetical protein [Nocardia camponoti]|uniref:Uncharacterized protein n=1 Tax=Nocardia camponoti TaxID=1616106 RepID=A0A917VB40_9NOCA|nr:hypothetical protein [Nocardia camponoti]GGK57569.1 hypothetical protein GCM10011591_32150 [Nocardia camponoti]